MSVIDTDPPIDAALQPTEAGATPETPLPLAAAAMVPATCVPWPLSS